MRNERFIRFRGIPEIQSKSKHILKVVGMQRGRIIVPLVVLAVFASSLALGPLNYALAQEVRGGGKKATSEKLIEIMSRAREHVDEIFSRLKGRGITIPEVARERFRMGVGVAEDAVRDLREGRIDEADDAALRAMSEFKKAMQLLGAANLTAAVSAQKGIEQAAGRAQTFLRKIQAIVVRAEELGYNTTRMRERIAYANATLNETLELVAAGKVDEAARKLGEARHIVDRLNGEVKTIARDEAGRRIERFTDRATKRLNELRNKTGELEIPPPAAAAIKSALDNARSHMERAKKLIREKNIKGAVEVLEEMVKEERRGVERLKKELPALSNRLKASVRQLESRIESLERQLASFEDRVDAAALRDRLQKARNLLKQALVELEKGDVEAASRSVRKAVELVKYVEGVVKDVTENQRGGGSRRRGGI